MSKDIKKALEHCIEWNCVDCPNREELGSGETVCRGRLLTDVLEYVSDLQSQLAEYQNDGVGDAILNAGKKIKELQQQLAEEKNRNKKLNHEAQKYYEDAYCNGFQKQDKISFAVEQLEKVKEIFGRVKWYHGYCNFGEVKYFDNKLVSWTDVEKEIDNQIKSLKGEK